ncbi:hypothetical protein KXS15_09585 [Sinorhizobium meliloti]|uniref:hypothetical protein n=1 Tax=Rhizobium meliloti TaxID=382 RepID=UPI003F17BE0E
MDSNDMYEAVKHAFIDAMATREPAPRMMRIDPFDAQDEDGEAVRVVGIIDDEDMMKFVVIEEGGDGEIYPIARSSIYRKDNATHTGGKHDQH